MKRQELVEVIARGVSMNMRGADVSATEIADDVVREFESRGLVVVPREPSEAMKAVAIPPGTEFPMRAYWYAMLDAASSDTRIEDAGLPKIPVLRIEGLDE